MKFHYPSRCVHELLIVILASHVLRCGDGGISGVLTYWIVKASANQFWKYHMAEFPGRPDEVEFSVAGIGNRRGCFSGDSEGRRRSCCCTGRIETGGNLLRWCGLQDHQYNVFVFDFAAHGAKRRALRTVRDIARRMKCARRSTWLVG